MAAETFDAHLDGYLLEVATLDDTFEKAIAVNEIPYRNGALTQDMGLKARRIKLRAYFYGANYDNHKAFAVHLKGSALAELDHPVYGSTKGRIGNVSVRYDDRQATAEVDLEFIEHLSATLSTKARVDVLLAAQEAQAKGLQEAKTDLTDKARLAQGAAAAGLCGTQLDPRKSAFDQFVGLSKPLGNWVKAIDKAVAECESCLTEVANPANGLISAIDFGLTLPGRVIGSVAKLCERYDLLFDSLKSSPEQFSRNFKDALNGLEQTLGLDDPSPIRTVGALQLGVSLAAIYADDEIKRDTARSLETAASFDEHGRCIKPAAAPALLDVGQIEQSLAIASETIQTAVSGSRGVQSLKTVAGLLTEHAVTVKLESESLTTRRIDEPLPLHLICHRAGLSYNYAARLLKVQTIPDPNHCQGDIKVYVN